MGKINQPLESMSIPTLLMYGVKHYVLWHINLINVIYINTIWRLDGNIFCLAFNFRAWLRRQEIRFSFDNISKKYIAKSDSAIRQFHAKYAAIGGYSNGLKARANDIAAAYHLNLIKFNDHDVIIDCGANIGDLKLFFDFQNKKIQYLAFEPSPDDFDCLVANVYPGNAQNIGLWHESGELTFYISTHNADSSFIEPINYTNTVVIQIQRLDELVKDSIKLLKIEAEGAEPEVLYGCEKLLPNIEYISVDLGYERGIAMESTLVPVTNYLLQHGFKLIDVGKARLVALYKNTRLESLAQIS
jgi:FkbM family methyltransferase